MKSIQIFKIKKEQKYFCPEVHFNAYAHDDFHPYPITSHSLQNYRELPAILVVVTQHYFHFLAQTRR